MTKAVDLSRSQTDATKQISGSGPLRILMVSARFHPYVGGTEVHTGQVATELVRRGHHVRVLPTQVTNELPSSDVVDGVEVTRIRAWPSWSDLYIAPGLVGAIRNADADVIHLQGYHTAVAPIALAVAQRTGRPTLVTFHSGGHSSTVRNVLRPVQVRLLHKALLRADRLIAVSRFEADLFAKRLGVRPDRIRVIPNGVSTSVPDDHGPRAVRPVAVPSAEAAAPTKTILSMGRLVRYKGHHRVIEAMPHVLRQVPEARLLILGQGPYEQQLRRLAERRGVADRVVIDWVPSDERHRLKSIMAEASLAVLLSSYESQGLTAHEAVGAGLPLVVLDRTALSELVAAGVAHAAPSAATETEIGAILARLLRSGASADGATGGRKVAPTTWSDVADRLVAEYRSVMQHPEAWRDSQGSVAL